MKKIVIILAILAFLAIIIMSPLPSRAQTEIEVPTETESNALSASSWCIDSALCANVTISDDRRSFLLGFVSLAGDAENNSSQYVYELNNNTPCFSSTVWGYAYSIITPTNPATWGEGEWSCGTGTYLFVQYDSVASKPIGLFFFNYEADTGKLSYVDSDIASNADIVFGLSILIVILFLFLIGFVFNHMKKPWR